MGKRNLYDCKHPFAANAFEALWSGSWWPVELIRVSCGYLNISSVDGRYVHENCNPTISVRIRSRRATLIDCTCFLRPGVDVCVLSGESSKPVWVDARISSVERKPHESGCSCTYYVKLYDSQRPLGSGRGVLSKDTIMMGINSISILQRLEPPQIEGQLHRWATSEDCASLPRTKILTGKFLCDLSWLLAASVIKGATFDIRSLDEKLVYQISDSSKCSKTVNFKNDGDILAPEIFEHVPDKMKALVIAEPGGSGLLGLSDVMELRRSKRRNVQPDRFMGCDVSKLQVDPYRWGLLKNDKWKEEMDEDEEMSLPLSSFIGKIRREQHAELKKRKRHSFSKNCSPSEGSFGSASRAEFAEEKENFAAATAANDDDKITINHLKTPTSGRRRGRKRKLEVEAMKQENNGMSFGQDKPQTKDNLVRDRTGEGGSYTGGSRSSGSTYSVPYYIAQKTTADVVKARRDLEERNAGLSWVPKASEKNADRGKYYRLPAKREYMNEKRIYGQKTLSAGLYKDLINSYMKSIDSTKIKEDLPLSEQWREFQARSKTSHRKEANLSPITNDPEEDEEEEESELDMLWREMELCMTSSYLFEDNEGPKDYTSNEYMEKAMNVCGHDFKLDEEIGIYCKLCGAVRTEVKDISPDFIHTTYGTTENKHNNETEEEQAEDEGLDITYNTTNSDMDISEENRNVWTLIPDLKKKLHIHQRKAFEFLWRNVAGSLIPAEMDSKSKITGGCVVSHTPGAGKTFLIIAFLVSYLKLFPGKRPLVLAPKTTLYTWHKEFVKWKIPVPVYLIHGRRSYRVFRQDNMEFEGLPKPGQDVMHVLDCLEKIQKWHSQPSVLVMGYTSFLTLIREDSKFAHRKHMAKILRESPGILILDEGHNPRSTKSRLRKGLMKVETDLRILLSGTLFQNNFCEYFNTLCLARPKFVNEVLKELDPKYEGKKKKKARHLLEYRARKFFIDNIGKKIDSKIGDERMVGINMLRNMTSGFIDVYEGGCGNDLPGLQSYTLMMNPTDIQLQVLLKLHRIMSQYNGFPLELELLITLGSIHPWLVKTACCAGKFLTSAELSDLEKHKFDIKKGSKIKFVLSLVYRVSQKEKTLIFCHNIAPIRLFLELFENIFGWKKGKEVLVLSGEMELFERGRVMDQFEEPGNPSRVLIASITACAEGVSLTAASRVILLDSEWNPSKTKQAIARAFRPGQQKMVYVYQLLAANTLEEDKYRRTTWKEWVSCMIFSEAVVEDPTEWQAGKIEDEILREMVEEDRSKSIHMIMKNEKASTN